MNANWHKRVLLIAMLCALLSLPGGALACVGKTLVVGSKGTVQQDILAQVLSLLISERTGTTDKVVRVDSTTAAHEALLRAELDMYVEYTGAGQAEVLEGAALADRAALYAAVKDQYNELFNLIWLEPLGFQEPAAVAGELPAEAAPVVRKDTLKKFPALARLINKLGGAIDDEAMRRMEAAAADQPVQEVARHFLKSNRLI